MQFKREYSSTVQHLQINTHNSQKKTDLYTRIVKYQSGQVVKNNKQHTNSQILWH